MKRLALVMALIVVATIVVHGQKKSPQTTANQHRAKSVTQPEVPAAPIVVINQEASNPQENRANSHAQSYFSRLLSPETLPNLLLVGVGIGGIMVAICTLKNIARQTRLLVAYTAATRRGVRATRASAKAAERTVAVLETDQRAQIGAVGVKLHSLHPGEKSKALLYLKNFGKSPAYRMGVDWYMEASPERDRWHAMGSGSPDVILFPGIRFVVPIETQALSLKEFEAISKGELILYVWGQVVYRITGRDDPCTTVFSFAYNPDLKRFLPCGGFWDTEQEQA